MKKLDDRRDPEGGDDPGDVDLQEDDRADERDYDRDEPCNGAERRAQPACRKGAQDAGVLRGGQGDAKQNG